MIERRSRSLANISRDPTWDASDVLELFHENAKIYFPKFGCGLGRNSFLGKSWAGGKTPRGRFSNVFRFRDGRI
jgi:hypothetical protein